MDEKLLHIVSCTLHAEADIDDALRHLRRCAAASDDRLTLLLFADLHASAGAKLPQDDAMIRRLQSGVMAMNARNPGRFLLLVRRRAWDDAARMYLGDEQALACREVIAQLLCEGRTLAVFDAATFTPSSLKDRFSAVLFSPLSLSATPDTPMRMLAALEQSAQGCVCAAVLHPRAYPETALARLARTGGFSLSALRAMQEDALARQGYAYAQQPAMFTRGALSVLRTTPNMQAPLAKGCFFVRRSAITLPELYTAYRAYCLKNSDAHALLPPIQLLLFIACALTGLSWLAAAALLPELWAVLRPRRLPGALLRTALLPLTAFVSLDALLCRLLSRSPLLRLRMPDSLVSAQGCMLTGAALLAAAIYSAQALVSLLPVCLLWLCAPLLLRALTAPTLERIPLDADQRTQLRTMAQSAYFDAAHHTSASPAMRMLTACAGCMLGILEPDEAARQIQQGLAGNPSAASSAEHAALLVCAQYLRERMADCDAALRELPAQLENHVRAKTNTPMPFSVCGQSRPLDALFLPLGPARAMAQHNVTLPLTHPHTFLKRYLLAENMGAQQSDPVGCFLGLAAAALDHPFYALMLRSPVAAPYMPLLAI